MLKFLLDFMKMEIRYMHKYSNYLEICNVLKYSTF